MATGRRRNGFLGNYVEALQNEGGSKLKAQEESNCALAAANAEATLWEHHHAGIWIRVIQLGENLPRVAKVMRTIERYTPQA